MSDCFCDAAGHIDSTVTTVVDIWTTEVFVVPQELDIRYILTSRKQQQQHLLTPMLTLILTLTLITTLSLSLILILAVNSGAGELTDKNLSLNHEHRLCVFLVTKI